MEEVIKEGFKVVAYHPKRKQLFSGDSIMPDGYFFLGGKYDGVIRYITNKWVKRKSGCGPLCIFTSWADAEKWTECPEFRKIWRIYKCKYKPSDERYVYTVDKLATVCDTFLPDGTDFAEEVMITERMKRTWDTK